MDADLAGGVAAAAVAAVCLNAAVILYAIESRTISSDHGLRLSLVTRLIRRPLWLAGIGLDAIGWPFQLLALSLAPLTVVQPMLSVGILLLLVVGSRRLGERVGPRQVAAAAAIILGVVVLAAAAPAHSDTTDAGAIALTTVTAALLLVTAAPYLVPRGRAGALLMILSAGCAFTATAISSKLVTEELANGRWLSALALGIGTGAVAAAGLLTQASALQRWEATRISPGVFVVQTVLPVIAAPLLIGEDWGSTPGGGVVIVIGLVTTCAGGALLSRSRAVVAAESRA